MKPAAFTYHAPKTIEQAIDLLARLAPEDGRILAGGQSLVPIMNFRLASPAHLIDINGIAGLDRIREEAGELVIPACVRHAAFARPVTAGPLGALLAAIVPHIAHYPIRTRGTFCGSLAHADPSSEWCLVGSVLDATLVARSVRGMRRIAAKDFFAGIMTTNLAPDEFLVEARLPLLPPDARFGFYEFARRAGDFAMAAALAVWRPKAGRIAEPRLGVGGCEPKPRRVVEAEAILAGGVADAATFSASAEAAAVALKDVMEDARTSAAFRRALVRTVVRRALERSLA
jgi:carbon-monoxide dehydrogenase medium subunit